MMTTSARLVFVVGGTVLFFGLTILAEGGFAAFFSHPALIGLAAVQVVLSGAAFFVGGNVSPGKREDRSNRWVLAAFGIIMLLQTWLPAWTDRWASGPSTARPSAG